MGGRDVNLTGDPGIRSDRLCLQSLALIGYWFACLPHVFLPASFVKALAEALKREKQS